MFNRLGRDWWPAHPATPAGEPAPDSSSESCGGGGDCGTEQSASAAMVHGRGRPSAPHRASA